MNEEQRQLEQKIAAKEVLRRSRALKAVVKMFGECGQDFPDAAEAIALADWLMEGSISIAAALKGQQMALYNEWVRTQEDGGSEDLP